MEDHHQAPDQARLELAPGLDKTVRRFFVGVLDFRATGVCDGRCAHEWLAIIRVVYDLTPKPTGTIEWE